MFGSSYWYIGPAPDGRRFCYAKHATFRCPIQEDASELRVESPTDTDGLLTRAAAAALGVDARWLSMRVAGASHYRDRTEDGKLTDRCKCGAKMERLGFAIWTEREADEREDTGAEITRYLGGTPTEQLGERRYAETKREAQQWARDEYKIAQAANVEDSMHANGGR